MSMLAVDAGNTRIKWALHDGAAWSLQGYVVTAESDKLGDALACVPRGAAAAVANVAGPAVGAAIARALETIGAAAQWVSASAQACGVRSGYAAPEQLGADRWAALIAARARYAGPCVVVNVGTTMTVDALSGEGVFLGGCIVPGIALMQQTLARNTAGLALQEGTFLFFPDNTGDAIASGAINALAGTVDRMAGYLQQAEGAEPLVVLSGGGAAVLAAHLQGRMEQVDNLVLEGLLKIAAAGEDASGR
jgi:type III pantothenate kinase